MPSGAYASVQSDSSQSDGDRAGCGTVCGDACAT